MVVDDYIRRGQVRCIDQPSELASLPHLLELMRSGAGVWHGHTVRGGGCTLLIDRLGHETVRAQFHAPGNPHVREHRWTFRDGTYCQAWLEGILRDIAEDGPAGPVALLLIDREAWKLARLHVLKLAEKWNVAAVNANGGQRAVRAGPGGGSGASVRMGR